MSISIVMPQLGLTMTEGTISEWLKKPGDVVRKNEPLFIVSTDKVEMEVEALVEGKLKEIVVPPGETVAVGTPVAYLEGAGESPAPAPAKAEAAPAPVETAAPATSETAAPARSNDGRVQASPRAKRLAKELGVDLATVRGTDDGRISEDDVRRASESAPAKKAAPGSKRRQIIAERLTYSIQNVPTFSLGVEVLAENLLSLHENLQEAVIGKTGVKLTITDLLLACLASAIKDYPAINASWRDGALHPGSSADLGIAVATGQGVIAPVLRAAEGLDLFGLVERRNELIGKARQDNLSLRDLEGGTGTLSNLGMYPVDEFQAIITPGQSFILAVGRVRNRPWADAKLVVKPTIKLNLTVDHRVVDGAEGAEFLGKLVERIENPGQFLEGLPAAKSGRRRANG
ncbi:MAG: 2-oxo acid dehydrogenase subunit E2 [Acidobacteria bacterium]|jgi:pyruvate dehydrogenase E2 component (dihydrolipoamide acetyltransferase)|nr:2-oxo acid dehydrogenase subunit E2 [Acidobacteriota bacterium]